MRHLFLFLFCFAVLACSTPERPTSSSTEQPGQEEPAPQAAERKEVTINATDEGGLTIPQVNLWDNYQTRSRVVAQVRHGDKVFLIRQEGGGVLIETRSGERGWVSAPFIAELR